MTKKYTVKLPKPHAKQLDFMQSTAKRKVIRAGRRSGKAQPLTAKIYTPTGYKIMADIKIGDKVLTPAGGVARVEGVYPQGIQDIYRVSFGGGEYAESTFDHLWEIKERRTDSVWKERTRVVTTEQLSKMKTITQVGHGTKRRPTIPSTSPVRFMSQDVPIDPYLLGVLIGDGSMLHESVMVSAYDPYIREQVSKRLPQGMTMRRDGDKHDYVLSVGMGVYENPIIRALKKLNLWGKYSYEKYIPDVYKYNSIEVRMGIIQGILDTDGFVDQHGQPRLEQTSERLAKDVAEVIQSMGGLCTLRVKKNSYKYKGVKVIARDVYRQSILFPDASCLFTLPAKKQKAKRRAWPVKRYIHKVEKVREEAAQCIKISDPAGLYLTDNFIATHNTVGIAIFAIQEFLKGRRVLYAAPTSEQIGRFWTSVTNATDELTRNKIFYKNETEHIIELKGTEQRLRAKTCWNADTLRGDYCSLLIFDEYQLINEDAWAVVGAPMLLDNDGDAVFIYTPPSLHSRSVSKANDPQHAAKLFKKAALLGKSNPGRWATFHFSSMDNPYISQDALAEITSDMSSLAYRMEILAEDIDQAPGALWTRENIEKNRVIQSPELSKIVVAIDPTTSADGGGDAAGIIVAGTLADQGFILEDCTLNGSPLAWAQAAVDAYHRHKANLIVAEKNQGGEMVAITIKQVDKDVPVKLVHAARGKNVRAEPVSAKYEKNLVHHVGNFPALEDELCLWLPGDKSPNRLDALVWAITDLIGESFFSDSVFED
jgi:hypothetical protein